VSASPVLCAFDASEPSVLAAQAAVWLAAELGAPLEFVYVVDHDELPALPRRGPARDPEVRRHLRELQEQRADARARAEVDAALFALRAEGASGTILVGTPVGMLRRRASERGAALLVSGTARPPWARAHPPRQRHGRPRRGGTLPCRGRPARRDAI
jgi:nucleotide-binding universal stress UspA family protein